MSYRFRRDPEGEFSLSLLCRVFGLARRGYPAWKKQGGKANGSRPIAS